MNEKIVFVLYDYEYEGIAGIYENECVAKEDGAKLIRDYGKRHNFTEEEIQMSIEEFQDANYCEEDIVELTDYPVISKSVY